MSTMDPLKKIDEIEVRNEALWGDIANKLGFGGKTQSKNSFAKSLSNGKYELGGNLIHRLMGVSEQQFLQYDWTSGKLSFLKDGKWEAKELQLQMAAGTEAVTLFWGEWNSGSFVGNFFGDFRGESFMGNFKSAYNSYASDPSTFVDGKIQSYDRGVLGIPKIDVISLDAGSQKKHVSLLELQVGHYCNITDDRGTMHSFRMIKCCDNSDMSIELEEQTGQRRSVVIAWKEIRNGNDPNLFRRRSSIIIGSKLQIPYLFANDRIGTIANIEVSTKSAMFGATNDTYVMDMSLVRPLKYITTTATVHLFSPEEVVEFGKIHQDLDNNAMQLHLSNIMDGIRFGIITGWNGYPHLSDMFSRAEGSPVKHSKYATSMEWLDRFVQFVVLRMMKSKKSGGAYEPNGRGRKVIMDQLRSVADQAGFNVAQPSPKSSPTSTSTTKRTPPTKSIIP